MASPLKYDDLRNVKQALVMHNSLDIFIAIKLILGWDVFFHNAFAEFERKKSVRSEFSSRFDAGVLGVHPRAEVAEGRRVQIRTLVQKDCWLRLVKDLSVLNSKHFLLFGNNVTEHQQLH